ncbi:MAG: ATP-binding protein [Polyangiaceae bacterium]|nr:ATP-binding protein [Polyangiaceae bacterium]
MSSLELDAPACPETGPKREAGQKPSDPRGHRQSLDTFPWKQQPSLKRPMIEQLATLDFVDRAANIVFVGETGVGKTGIASAILMRALERGYRGLFIKAQDLFDEMYKSLADRSSPRLLKRLVGLPLCQRELSPGPGA